MPPAKSTNSPECSMHVPQTSVCALLLLSAQILAAGDLRLIEAVKDQDRKAIDTLLRSNADVNTSQPDGATPLAWALYLDQSDTVDALLKAGAKVNTADE